MSTRMPPAPPWWRHAAVYQVYVRSFADSDDDGIGDLAGIRSRLGYIASLGVDALWLTPCYPSPQHDHGYDVSDYFGIDPRYGDLTGVQGLIDDAHAHDLKLLMDVVPCHCSVDHEWFRAAVAGGPGCPERARFFFRDGRGPHADEPPNNWWATFGGPAWTRVTEPDGAPGQWYLHSFTPWQPDWDWAHPDVVDHFQRMLRFWFAMGVDGFRVDAVSVVAKAPGLPDAPPPRPGMRDTDMANSNPYVQYVAAGHDVWRGWRRLVDEVEAARPDHSLYVVPEAWAPGRPDVLADFVRPDEFHQTFAFDPLLARWTAEALHEAIAGTLRVIPGAKLAWALNNHDSERIVSRYGRDGADRPGVGPAPTLNVTRAAVDIALGTRRARALALVLMALPGSAFVYQGEELGLPEVLDLPDDVRQDPIFARTGGRQLGRDGCRIPIPWTPDEATSYGFSPDSGSGAPWLPQPAGWGTYAAAGQEADPASMLALYRTALHLRRKLADLADAELVWRNAPAGVLAFQRGRIVTVLNTRHDPVELDGELADVVAGAEVLLASAPADEHGVVPQNATVWLCLASMPRTRENDEVLS